MTEHHANWNERLVRMANEIARNFAAIGHERAAAATADHIAQFWDRRMKSLIFSEVEKEGNALSPVAAAAVLLLKKQGPPPPQTRATQDIPGASDAG